MFHQVIIINFVLMVYKALFHIKNLLFSLVIIDCLKFLPQSQPLNTTSFMEHSLVFLTQLYLCDDTAGILDPKYGQFSVHPPVSQAPTILQKGVHVRTFAEGPKRFMMVRLSQVIGTSFATETISKDFDSNLSWLQVLHTVMSALSSEPLLLCITSLEAGG